VRRSPSATRLTHPHLVRNAAVATTLLAMSVGLAASPALAAAHGPAAQPQGLPGQQVSGMLPAGSPDAPSLTAARSSLLGAATAASYLLGTDVASYQHPGGKAINWATVAASGQAFTIVKATESTNYTNPYVMTDVTGARAAGLLVGVYHFAHPDVSATAQADYFARQVNGIGGTLLPPVLDLEQTGGLSSAALISWTSSFLARVRQDTGRIPMIYSGPYFWSTAMAGSTAFSRYPLWEAHYTTATQPQSITGWPTWTLWQYSDGTFGSPAAVPGIPAVVDRDRFAGTKAQLVALASSSRPGIQPPFTGTATASQFPDSTFVLVAGDPHVYSIAGLAPLWVTSWSHVGGPKPFRVISLASFHTLRSSPLDGTFLDDGTDGRVYRVVGGAPVIVTSWPALGGRQPSVRVDDWDIANAGTCGGYCSLSMKPRDGTILRAAESGQIYVVAGGAPIYVSTWSTFGGVQPYVNVNQASIQDAGLAAWFDHLTFVPADATMVSDGSTGQLYVVTSGKPQVANPGTLGTVPFTLVDHAAILNAGGTGVWAHLL
jgi:GH25 family lysozyme M1 (1,4-beta-N-acetylmuramidase)